MSKQRPDPRVRLPDTFHARRRPGERRAGLALAALALAAGALVAPADAGAAKVLLDGGADPEWVETIEDLQETATGVDTRPLPLDPTVSDTVLEWSDEIVDCSALWCDPADQQLVEPGQPANDSVWPSSVDAAVSDGYRLFDERNFAPLVDAFGRERRFYVHLPARYASVDGVAEKIPVLFVFHGGVTKSEPREMMIVGKWDEHFEGDVALVFPKAEKDPCNSGPDGKFRWLRPGIGQRGSLQGGQDPTCPPETLIHGDSEKSFWGASLPESFSDVHLVAELRSMLLDRFPKLDPDRVYATGFSSGGGMVYSLLCYRSRLFRGYSVVASTLGRGERGDYLDDGIDTTDPDSLVATCGKGVFSSERATGIDDPHPWGPVLELASTATGTGARRVTTGTGAGAVDASVSLLGRVTRPLVLFVGDQDVPSAPGATLEEAAANLASTSALVRERNNLSGLCAVVDPFSDVQADAALTQRCSFGTPADASLAHAPFRRFLVRGEAVDGRPLAGNHGMPDTDECRVGNTNHMTCDYDYTDQTLLFFQDHAGL